MITAETLNTLTSFTAPALERALAIAGRPVPQIRSSRFLGLTNAGQFCYRIDYANEDPRGQTHGKVFLNYNEDGSVTADY